MKKINLLIFTLSMFLFISVPSICYAEEKEPSTEIKCTDEGGIAIEDGSTVKEEQILTCSLHLKDANSATLKESAEIKLKSLEYDEDTLSKDSAIIISDGNLTLDKDKFSTVSVSDKNLGAFDVKVLGEGDPEISISYTITDTITGTIPDESTPKNYNLSATWTAKIGDGEDVTLSEIKIDGESASGSGTNYSYTTTKDSVSITPVASDGSKAIKINGEDVKNPYSLKIGSNTFTINVGSKDYTLTIIREEVVEEPDTSTYSLLSSLNVNGVAIKLSNSNFSYTYNVSNSVTKPNITYTTYNPDATVQIDGPDDLSVGDNTYKISVTSSEGTNVYTLNIVRAGKTSVANPEKNGIESYAYLFIFVLVSVGVYIFIKNKDRFIKL